MLFHLYKKRKAKIIKVINKIQGCKEKGQRTRFLVFRLPKAIKQSSHLSKTEEPGK